MQAVSKFFTLTYSLDIYEMNGAGMPSGAVLILHKTTYSDLEN